MDRSDVGDEGASYPDRLEDTSSNKESVFTEKRGSIVTARGTGDGLILRLDGRALENQLMEALSQFVESRHSFLEGNEIVIEWVGKDPDLSLKDKVQRWLEDSCNVSVRSSIDSINSGTAAARAGSSSSRGARVMRLADRVEVESERKSSLGLFGGIEGLDMTGSIDQDELIPGISDAGETSSAMDIASWDDPDARIVYKTLRSGQKVETEHSLIIIGDVNSGAELVAGGDIIVLGSLRGVAHAGAYDETGGGRFIIATDLQPTQLRIGSIISRGSGEGRSQVMEIARVDGNLIVVEPFSSRSVSGFKK